MSVPNEASRVSALAGDRTFLEPQLRRTRLTPVGWAVIAVGLLASVVPGVRLVGASILSAALLAPGLSWLAMRRLRLASPSPACVLAGDVLKLDVLVRNVSRWFTARDVTLHHVSEHGGNLRAAWYLPDLAPGETLATEPRFRSLRRGRIRGHRVVAITSFPFGLAFSLAEFALPTDLLVLPRPGQARNIYELMGFRGLSPSRASHSSSEGEFVGLREWREGESPRLIHWKSTARRGRPILRELVSEDRQPVHLILATGVLHLRGKSKGTAKGQQPEGSASSNSKSGVRSRQASERAFERAVSVAATLAAALLRNGHRVRVSVTGVQCESARRGRGRSGLFPLLAVLADAEPSAEMPDLSAGALGSRAERVVCLVAGTRESVGAGVVPPGPRALLLFADDPSVRARFVERRAPRLGRTVLQDVR